jgi:hypothetical protein
MVTELNEMYLSTTLKVCGLVYGYLIPMIMCMVTVLLSKITSQLKLDMKVIHPKISVLIAEYSVVKVQVDI